MAVQATIIYPPKHAFTTPINVEDRLAVTYTSDWTAANLTMLCLGSTTADNSEYLYHNVDDNPILANGTYIIPSIESMDLDIRQYPTQCKLRLTEFGNNANNVDGGQFVLTSTNGLPTTFSMSATASTADSSGQPTNAEATSVSTSTTPPNDTDSSSASSETSPTYLSMSPGSSDKPVNAAIAVAIAISAVSLLFLTIVTLTMVRRKRRHRTVEEKVGKGHGKGELGDGESFPPLIAPARSAAGKIDIGSQLSTDKDDIRLTTRISIRKDMPDQSFDEVHPALRPSGEDISTTYALSKNSTIHETDSVGSDDELIMHKIV